MSDRPNLLKKPRTLETDVLHAGLLSRCSSGDQRAFKTLWDLLEPFLRKRVARRMVREADVDDVLASTMETVWRSASKFKGQSEVLTWATAIALRQLPKWNRKALELEQSLESDVMDELLWTDEEASSALQADQQTGIALRGVKALEKPVQDCVRMHYLHGASLDAVAASLAIPVGTVKTRLLRARKEMRSWMEAHQAC